MIIYPAIDLKDGKCVRLVQGDMAQDTIYNDDPAAQAALWARAGFGWIHIVDLDGAIKGKPANEKAVKSIIAATDVPVQLGGGIRTLEQIKQWLDNGVSRIILGTVAVRDPELVERACALFPNQIAVGIDARKGFVAVEGWVDETEIRALDLARRFEECGVCAIIYTDIDRDGMGEGVNIEETIELAKTVRIPIIASGGIGSLEDVSIVKKAALEHGLNGVIIGRAFYDDAINPAQALKISGETL